MAISIFCHGDQDEVHGIPTWGHKRIGRRQESLTNCKNSIRDFCALYYGVRNRVSSVVILATAESGFDCFLRRSVQTSAGAHPVS
jgi:hypothetical protein